MAQAFTALVSTDHHLRGADDSSKTFQLTRAPTPRILDARNNVVPSFATENRASAVDFDFKTPSL